MSKLSSDHGSIYHRSREGYNPNRKTWKMKSSLILQIREKKIHKDLLVAKAGQDINLPKRDVHRLLIDIMNKKLLIKKRSHHDSEWFESADFEKTANNEKKDNPSDHHSPRRVKKKKEELPVVEESLQAILKNKKLT